MLTNSNALFSFLQNITLVTVCLKRFFLFFLWLLIVDVARFVLAVGSAVFDAMFNGGMATTSTEIELPDVEPSAFLALLK